MKKFLLVLLIATTVVGMASAIDFLNYAEGIGDQRIHINAGIGFGGAANLISGASNVKLGIPPVQASIEYAMPSLPLSVGGFFAITTYNWEYTYSSYIWKRTWSWMAFGGKASWHINMDVPNLDTYVSLTAGWMLYNSKSTDTGSTSSYYNYDNTVGEFYFGGNVGVKYFFIPNIGVYAEAGYSALFYVNGGLAIKF